MQLRVRLPIWHRIERLEGMHHLRDGKTVRTPVNVASAWRSHTPLKTEVEVLFAAGTSNPYSLAKRLRIRLVAETSAIRCLTSAVDSS